MNWLLLAEGLEACVRTSAGVGSVSFESVFGNFEPTSLALGLRESEIVLAIETSAVGFTA